MVGMSLVGVVVEARRPREAGAGMRLRKSRQLPPIEEAGGKRSRHIEGERCADARAKAQRAQWG